MAAKRKKKSSSRKFFDKAHPSREGDFTAKAHRAGMGVQEYARHVLAPGSKSSTTTKRQASFAKASRTVAKRHQRGRRKS